MGGLYLWSGCIINISTLVWSSEIMSPGMVICTLILALGERYTKTPGCLSIQFILILRFKSTRQPSEWGQQYFWESHHGYSLASISTYTYIQTHIHDDIGTAESNTKIKGYKCVCVCLFNTWALMDSYSLSLTWEHQKKKNCLKWIPWKWPQGQLVMNFPDGEFRAKLSMFREPLNQWYQFL